MTKAHKTRNRKNKAHITYVNKNNNKGNLDNTTLQGYGKIRSSTQSSTKLISQGELDRQRVKAYSPRKEKERLLNEYIEPRSYQKRNPHSCNTVFDNCTGKPNKQK